tara:strand:+ start:38 stop:1039 length:1002 start_codon:yes stop_codon:yes gene_type:complete
MPRSTQSKIHSDFSTSSGTWVNYRTGVTAFYDSFPHSELNDHITREFNKKIRDLGQPESLYISPFDSGLRYTGDGNFDADASAYITLIEGDGVSVSSAQKTAIHTFFKTGKSDGWYSHLKRAYFPVWGAAAPNARCLVSGTSGTFNGSVGQSAGFIEGNGGYFKPDAGGGLDDLSLTQTNCHMAILIKSHPGTNRPVAGNESGGARFSLRCRNEETDIFWLLHQTTSNAAIISGKTAGIFVGTGNTSVSTTLLQKGRLSEQEDTSTQTAVSLPSGEPFLLGRSVAGAASSVLPSDISAGFWSYGTSLHSKRSEFAAAMKTLWETVTGLTLPNG